ncbi:hypothetical protein UlMin_023657 [Ulmus minor]
MASGSQAQVIVLLVLSILVVASTARPCKTLLISSYSFSLRQPSSHSSSGTLTIFAQITQFRSLHGDGILLREEHLRRPPRLPSSYDLSSLRDRTKDILSVVVALLFGVGCGALTAATMYLAWSLFSGRPDSSLCADHSDGDDSDSDSSPKKMGYCKIPAADSVPAKQTGV